jgi:hypothetical protein
MAAPAWRAGFAGYTRATTHPRLFDLGERLARLALRPWARRGLLRSAPGPLAAWTRARDLRLPPRESFRRLWRRRPPGVGGRPNGASDAPRSER